MNEALLHFLHWSAVIACFAVILWQHARMLAYVGRTKCKLVWSTMQSFILCWQQCPDALSWSNFYHNRQNDRRLSDKFGHLIHEMPKWSHSAAPFFLDLLLSPHVSQREWAVLTNTYSLTHSLTHGMDTSSYSCLSSGPRARRPSNDDGRRLVKNTMYM